MKIQNPCCIYEGYGTLGNRPPRTKQKTTQTLNLLLTLTDTSVLPH